MGAFSAEPVPTVNVIADPEICDQMAVTGDEGLAQ
jgi:hypothetical protein